MMRCYLCNKEIKNPVHLELKFAGPNESDGKGFCDLICLGEWVTLMLQVSKREWKSGESLFAK